MHSSVILIEKIALQVGLTAGKPNNTDKDIPTFCGGSVISQKVNLLNRYTSCKRLKRISISKSDSFFL